MTAVQRRLAEGFREANLECARIIAADPIKYPPGSLLPMWADLVLNPSPECIKAEIGRAA